MFFYIGNNNPFQSLTRVDNNLYLDKGWTNKESIWYKGYSTECKISEKLEDILQGHQPDGKWCVIHNNCVYHSKFRGFPLYQLDNQITNIQLDGYEFILNKIPPPTTDNILTLDEASIIIGDILLENTKNFFKYNDIDTTFNVLFSGGLDTLTSWSVLDSMTKNYVLEVYVPDLNKKYTSSYEILGRIREYESDLMDKVSSYHWGYGISSFYSNTNWYLTGFYAEVIQFRDAEAIYALASYRGKYIDELAEPNDYLYWFLKRSTLDKYKKEMLQFDDDQSLKKYLYDTVFVDYQMWHFDNNMTFSPFFDIRITDTMLKLSIDDITKNALTGIIQRKIVERFNSQLLLILAEFKNEKGPFNNFRKNFGLIQLDPKVKINLR
jgi:hypothetical protein